MVQRRSRQPPLCGAGGRPGVPARAVEQRLFRARGHPAADRAGAAAGVARQPAHGRAQLLPHRLLQPGRHLDGCYFDCLDLPLREERRTEEPVPTLALVWATGTGGLAGQPQHCHVGDHPDVRVARGGISDGHLPGRVAGHPRLPL